MLAPLKMDRYFPSLPLSDMRTSYSRSCSGMGGTLSNLGSPDSDTGGLQTRRTARALISVTVGVRMLDKISNRSCFSSWSSSCSIPMPLSSLSSTVALLPLQEPLLPRRMYVWLRGFTGDWGGVDCTERLGELDPGFVLYLCRSLSLRARLFLLFVGFGSNSFLLFQL